MSVLVIAAVGIGWLTVGWGTLVVGMALIGKPTDSDERALCAIAMLLWPLSIIFFTLTATMMGIAAGLNFLVKQAVAPSDALARIATRAWQVPQGRLTAKVQSTRELRQARKEVDDFLGNP